MAGNVRKVLEDLGLESQMPKESAVQSARADANLAQMIAKNTEERLKSFGATSTPSKRNGTNPSAKDNSLSYSELAEKAQKEYDDYVQSDTYSQKRMKALRQKLLEAAVTQGAAATDNLANFTVNDPTEQELRAKVDYFTAEAQKEKDQAMQDADMTELASWPEEDRQALILYATNRNRDAYQPIELKGAPSIQTAQEEAKPLIQKYGIQRVNELAESYMRMQTKQLTEDVSAKTKEAAGSGFWAGVGHSAASVGANLLGSLTSPLAYLVEYSQRTGRYSTMDPNNVGMIPNVYADSARGAVAENITGDEYDENGQLAKDGGKARGAMATVYQAGMSALDNLARIAASGGVGAVSLGLAASGTFGRSMSEYSAQGASPMEATFMSAVDAGLEVATEKFSLDNLLKQATSSPANFPDFMKSLAKSGAIEVSEEVASFMGSALAQAVVLQEKSSYNQQITQGVAEGKSYAEAKRAADLGVIHEAAQTMVQSFLSGGMMSGAAQLKGAGGAASLGKNLTRQGLGQQETAELIQKGLESDPKSTAKQVAEQLQIKQGKGKSLNSYDQGRMYQAAMQSEDASFSTIIQRQIEENMRRKYGGQQGEAVRPLTAESTQETTVTPEVQQSLDRMSKATGRSVQIYSQSQTAAGMENGFYENGIIHINAQGKEPHVQVFSHELTHSVEMADSYKELSKLIFGRIEASGVDLETLRKDKTKLYADNGHKLNAADVDAEIIADYVADHLLTDEQSVVQLTQESRTLAEKIKGWLDRMLARLGNQDAQERVFLQNARNLYAKALSQTQVQKAADAQPSVNAEDTAQHDRGAEENSNIPSNMEEYREWIDEQYRAGRLTQEEYDEQMEYFQQQEELGELAPRQSQYSITAASAADNELEALQRAKRMEEMDVSAETIRRKTGWYRGADGKWSMDDPAQDTAQVKENSLPEMESEKSVIEKKGEKQPTGYIPGTVEDSEIEENINAVAAMEPVITIKPDEFKMGGGNLVKDVSSFFESMGGSVYNDRLGIIFLRKRGVRHDLGHGMSDEKATSFAAIPDVLKNGKVVGFAENKGNKGYDSAIVMAPINIGANPYMMGVIVHRSNGENTFYVHDVFAIKEEAAPLITGTRETGESGGTASTISIFRKIMNVKRNTGISQVPDDNAPSRDVRNELASTPTDSVADGGQGVKQQFSISPVANDQSQQETTDDSQQEKRDIRSSLPAKARSYLERAERELLDGLSNNLNVPRFAKREYLASIVKELSEEYLQEGTVNQKRADFLFDMAFANGVVADAEFYNQYKDIKQYLRKTKITISDQDKSDIADFRQFKNSAFGTLTIVNNGGLPVDSAYEELRSMGPELFPEDITHPADQLQHMYDVARGIQVSEKNLSEYYGDNTEEFRTDSRNAFQESVRKMSYELKTVKDYADEDAAKKAEQESVPTTPEEAKQAYGKLKDTRRGVERAEARNLLRDADKIELGRLLRGEILLEHLDPEKNNVKGITEVYEAKKEYEAAAKLIAKYKEQRRNERKKKADSFLETAMNWKDKKSGIQYSRETMRRNVFDIVPDKKLAQQISDYYFETVHTAEAEATRFKTEFRDKVRAMNLVTKVRKGDLVSESHAVQLYGEAMDNIEMLRKTRGRMKIRDGKTLDEWQAVVDDMFAQSPSLDRNKIEQAVKDFRNIYDDLFERMNEVRLRNGYEPVNYRKGYFPHFQPGDGDSMLTQFGKALGIDTQVSALPTTINGLTHTFKPGIQWFGYAQERLGFNTAYDAVAGFDKYIEGVANVIYHTENIQNLRALESQIRYRTSDEGIRKQVDAVTADTRLTEDEKRMKIDDIYKNGKYALSNFVNELSEYTNLLAGKKSRLDRGVEAMFGRRAYTVMKNLESRVGANMIAGNLGSALTNFIPLTQASAQLDRNMILKGMWDTLRSYKEDDGIVGMSSFLTNRRGSDTLVKTWTDTVSQALGKPMELIDNFVSDSIVRAAYQQNLRYGMSESEAMYQADIFASGVMADRSKGSMPTLFESKNPVFKAFTQFQLEVNNQFSEVFKDIPRKQREKGLGVLAGVLLKYFFGAFLYNEVYEYFLGRRPAMDPIGILNDTVGDWTGYELPNLVEWGTNAVKGEETSFETEKVGGGEAIANMGGQIVQQLPFVSGLADGGRIPVSGAIPDLSALWDAATTEDWSSEKRWDTAKQELNKLAYIAPPFAGGQISKSWKGIKAYLEGGSYTVDDEGNDILQYPVFKEEDGFGTFVKAALFGKSALPTAQEWAEGGYGSLNAKQTAVYQDMVESGTGEKQAYDIIRQLGSVEKTETQSVADQQREILMGPELSPEAKAITYYGLMASETDRELMDTLAEQEADSGEVAAALMKIQDAGKLKGAEGSCAKRDAIAEAALTDDIKHQIYREKVSDSREDEISQILATGLAFDDFLEIQNSYTRINEEYDKAGDKATQFSHWLNQQGYTERQITAAKESFKYFNMYPATAEKYDSFVTAGLAEGKAYDLATELSKLKPAAGEEYVDDLQKYRVIVDSGLTQKEQMQALESALYEGLYTRVNVVYNNGVSPEKYLQFREILPSFDSNGSGNYSQSEVKAALDSMGASGDDNPLLLLIGEVKTGEGLTNAQKAAIWQSYNKTWKPNRNPYDKMVGQRVYNMMHSDTEDQNKETTSESTGSFSDEVMQQLLASMNK